MTDNSVLGTHSNYIVKVAFGEISAALWDIHTGHGMGQKLAVSY